MEITNIVPCIKVSKENEIYGVDCYIDAGTRIKVIEDSGTEIEGLLLNMLLSEHEEKDNMLYLLLDNQNKIGIEINCILDIQEK